jgi:hypothetical protein
LLDYRRCDVNSAADLDREIRDIFALDQVGRGDEITGTLHVDYVSEATKQASLIPALERRGVQIVWQKKPQVRKGYIRRAWREKPQDNHNTIEICEFAKDAMHWDSRESAEIFLSDLERGVTIPSAWGSAYICHELTLEQLPSGDYVISLEAPFIYTPKE